MDHGAPFGTGLSNVGSSWSARPRRPLDVVPPWPVRQGSGWAASGCLSETGMPTVASRAYSATTRFLTIGFSGAALLRTRRRLHRRRHAGELFLQTGYQSVAATTLSPLTAGGHVIRGHSNVGGGTAAAGLCQAFGFARMAPVTRGKSSTVSTHRVPCNAEKFALTSSYAGVAVVFWDLDNKIPPTGVSVNACVDALRAMLLEECDSVETVNMYANTATLACAICPEQGAAHLPEFPQRMDTAADFEHGQPPCTCPVCGKDLKAKSVASRRNRLRRHFEAHRREEKKRVMLRESLGKNMRASQRASLFHKTSMFVRGREAILKNIGRIENVVLKERTKRNCEEMQRIPGISLTPALTNPQAADEELILDIRALLATERSKVKAGTLCLVSDDGGFIRTLRLAQDEGWRIVTVSVREGMRERGHRGVAWDEILARAASTFSATPRGERIYFENRFHR
mmetsp:Transcript_31627/g.87290  ORF Transcript_31627/g.87290 Transcript_31627/m.87290 type:complete len:456 (-) Transcript_31627:103-1470(-)